MVNKKGYIRTLEAVIGIVIILLFIFSVNPKVKEKTESMPSAVETSLDFITEEINSNATLRTAVYLPSLLNCGSTPENCQEEYKVTPFISHNIPPTYSHDYRICDNPSCVLVCEEGDAECLNKLPPMDVSVYTADTIVAPSEDVQPRLVRVWVWRVR
ncbi:MAG: hypothetical protein ABIB71_04660 [Candidatus Woesearchaeota archaeon]